MNKCLEMPLIWAASDASVNFRHFAYYDITIPIAPVWSWGHTQEFICDAQAEIRPSVSKKACVFSPINS